MRRGQRSKAALPRWLLGVVRGLWGGSRLLKVAKKARTVYAYSRQYPYQENFLPRKTWLGSGRGPSRSPSPCSSSGTRLGICEGF